MGYDWVGLLFSVPVMVVAEPEMLVVADVISGKFCSSLAP
jgi:hypothetical protein